jgi:hypothetical protein
MTDELSAVKTGRGCPSDHRHPVWTMLGARTFAEIRMMLVASGGA